MTTEHSLHCRWNQDQGTCITLKAGRGPYGREVSTGNINNSSESMEILPTYAAARERLEKLAAFRFAYCADEVAGEDNNEWGLPPGEKPGTLRPNA